MSYCRYSVVDSPQTSSTPIVCTIQTCVASSRSIPSHSLTHVSQIYLNLRRDSFKASTSSSTRQNSTHSCTRDTLNLPSTQIGVPKLRAAEVDSYRCHAKLKSTRNVDWFGQALKCRGHRTLFERRMWVATGLGPVHLTYNLYFLACFFSRDSIFLS
jgi:hypothetical protein